MYRYKGSDDNTYVHYDYPHAYVYVESRNRTILLLIIIITIKFSIIISIRIIRSAHLSVTPSLDGRRRLQRDVRGAFPLVHMRVPSRPIVAQVRGDRISCRLYRTSLEFRSSHLGELRLHLHFYPSVAFSMLQWQCAQR